MNNLVNYMVSMGLVVGSVCPLAEAAEMEFSQVVKNVPEDLRQINRTHAACAIGRAMRRYLEAGDVTNVLQVAQHLRAHAPRISEDQYRVRVVAAFQAERIRLGVDHVPDEPDLRSEEFKKELADLKEGQKASHRAVVYRGEVLSRIVRSIEDANVNGGDVSGMVERFCEWANLTAEEAEKLRMAASRNKERDSKIKP